MANLVSKVSLSNFEFIKKLGQGGFGTVCLYRRKDAITDQLYQLYAIKEIEKNFDLERQILEEISGKPFLITMHDAFQELSKFYIVLEYIERGDLHTLLLQRKTLTVNETRFIVAEVALALEELHNLGIFYGDLKPENILIDDNGHVVFTDFGFSKKISDRPIRKPFHGYHGTLEYMAPEVMAYDRKKIGYNFSADWWSFGILCYELLSGTIPFKVKIKNEGERENEENIKALETQIQKMEPPMESIPDDNAKDLILKLLKIKPSQRIGIGDIKMHPFFVTIKWEDLAKKSIKSPLKLVKETDQSDTDHS